MSWSLGPAILEVGNDELNTTALTDQREQWSNANQHAEGEALEQIQQAQETALAIVRSGVVGGAGARVRFQASGHANPGHSPREGYSNDTVNLHLAQESVAEAPAGA